MVDIKRYKNLSFIAVLALSVWRDSSVLFQTSAPVGLDGYYYFLQVNSLIESGKLYFPSFTPLGFYIFALISFFLGDSVFSIKIGAICLQVLLVAGVFAVIFETTKNFGLGMFGMAIAAFSNLHFYYVGEFLNNLAAVMLIVWGSFGLIRYSHTDWKGWLVFSLTALLLSVLCHRSALVLIGALLFTFIAAACLLVFQSKIRCLAFAVLLAVYFSPLILLIIQNLVPLPLSITAEFLWNPSSPFFELGLMEKWVLVMTFCLGLSQLSSFPSSPELGTAPLIFSTVTLLSILFSLNPFLNHSNGPESIVGRFDTLAFLQVAISAPILIVFLAKRSPGFAFFVLFIIAGLLGWSALKTPASPGMTPDYLHDRENLVRELQLMRPHICDDPLIIAPHGKQFLVSAVLKIPSQQTPLTHRSYACVYWLVQQDERVALLSESEVISLLAIVEKKGELQEFIKINPHLLWLLSERRLRGE